VSCLKDLLDDGTGRPARAQLVDALCSAVSPSSGDRYSSASAALSSPVPIRAAAPLLRWISNRDNVCTATNPDSRWLFPGHRAGQPMRPQALATLVNDLGTSPSTALLGTTGRTRRQPQSPVVNLGVADRGGDQARRPVHEPARLRSASEVWACRLIEHELHHSSEIFSLIVT
jgi:hypothetical protein